MGVLARLRGRSAPGAPSEALARPSCAGQVVIDRVQPLAGGVLLVDGWASACAHGRALMIEALGAPATSPPAPLLRKERPDVCEALGLPGGMTVGFVGCVAAGIPGPVDLRLTCEHGSAWTFRRVAAQRHVDGSALLDGVVADPLRLREQVVAHVVPVVRHEVGRPVTPAAATVFVSEGFPDAARLNVVVPLYGNYHFLRNLLMHLAAHPVDGAVVTLVCDDPRMTADLAHWLVGWDEAYGVPVRLVAHDVNAGFAAACNTGARAVASQYTLLLNSDIFLRGDGGWANLLIAELEAGAAAAAPVLAYPDDSLQHAGMVMAPAPGLPGFTVPLHPGKGMPLTTLPDTPFSAELLSGAALMVATHRFEQVGGMPTWLGKGDFEDVALCHLLLEHGDLRVVPQVTWTHVEGGSYDRFGPSDVLVTLAKSVLLDEAVTAQAGGGDHG